MDPTPKQRLDIFRHEAYWAIIGMAQAYEELHDVEKAAELRKLAKQVERY